MDYGELLLRSIKKILPGTIGCIIGIVLAYLLLLHFNTFTVKRLFIYIIGFFISFLIITGITWLFYIFKLHKK